jgi:hypothetical protein
MAKGIRNFAQQLCLEQPAQLVTAVANVPLEARAPNCRFLYRTSYANDEMPVNSSEFPDHLLGCMGNCNAGQPLSDCHTRRTVCSSRESHPQVLQHDRQTKLAIIHFAVRSHITLIEAFKMHCAELCRLYERKVLDSNNPQQM